MSAVWREDLDQRISQLQSLRDRLTGCIGCGCLSLKLCQLMNPDDILSGEGPGPRNL
jgi:MerR family transcriptional regulator, redox-sensitive transcriptional activator SoxR